MLTRCRDESSSANADLIRTMEHVHLALGALLRPLSISLEGHL